MNPLYVRIANPDPVVLRGTLVVSQRIGSPWRGWALRTLELPVILSPGGSAAYLLPWALEPGDRTLRLELRGPDGLIATGELPFPAPAEGLLGYIGPPPAGSPALPAVPLSPGQLPGDPLLLTPFKGLRVGDVPLIPGAREALRAWGAFFQGSPALLDRNTLLAAVEEVPLGARPLGAVAAGISAYLGALYFAVGRLCREGEWRPCLAVFLLAIGASAAGTAFIRGERAVEVQWEIRDPRAPTHGLFFAAVAAKEAVEWELPGLWIELLPGEEGAWSGRDLRWTAGPTGWKTSFSVAPGKERVLWTIAPSDGRLPLERFVVGAEGIRAPDGRALDPWDFVRGLPRGLRPVVGELLGGLGPGDAVRLGYRLEGGKDRVRHRFAIVLERATG